MKEMLEKMNQRFMTSAAMQIINDLREEMNAKTMVEQHTLTHVDAFQQHQPRGHEDRN